MYTMQWLRPDDDMLWNGSEEVGNVSSECEEDEGTYWVDRNGDIDWLRWIESDILCV